MNQPLRHTRFTPVARTISADLQAVLPPSGPLRGRVMDRHAKACNLWLEQGPKQNSSGSILSLVDAKLGNGPAAIMVANFAAISTAIEPGDGVLVDTNTLSLGPVRLDLSDCDMWNPKPDWQRARHANWHQAVAAAHGLDAPQSLLSLFNPGAAIPHNSVAHQVCRYVGQTIDDIVWQPGALPYAALARAARKLAGVGFGLTPAADDFLCGVMLACWLLDDHAAIGCSAIAANARALTTPLSAAFLDHAADGYCRAIWHDLLAAVIAHQDAAISAALNAIAAQGATSGADSLAGFFWVLRNAKTGVPQ